MQEECEAHGLTNSLKASWVNFWFLDLRHKAPCLLSLLFFRDLNITLTVDGVEDHHDNMTPS